MLEVEPDVDEVISQGQRNELYHLQYQLQQCQEANERLEKALVDKDNIHQHEMAILKTERDSLEAQYYEKIAEINMLKSSQETDTNSQTIHEILNLLGCTTIDQVSGKIVELQNTIKNLQIANLANQRIGAAECPNCALYQQELENMSKNNLQEIQELQRRYESQILIYKQASKQDLSMTDFSKLNQEISQLDTENTRLRTKISNLEETISQLHHENMNLKQEQAQFDINNKLNESKIEELTTNMQQTQKREEIINTTFTNLIKRLNLYRSQNGSRAVAVCEQLSRLLEELLIKEMTSEPDLDGLLEVLASAQQSSGDVSQASHVFIEKTKHILEFFELLKNESNTRLDNMEKQLNSVSEKVTSHCTDMNEFVQELQEQINEYQRDDMAPKVMVLMKQIDELKEKLNQR